MTKSISVPTISQLLLRDAELYGDKIVLSSPGRRITHRDLLRRTACIACRLISHGVGRGSYVVVFLDRCVEAVESILAIIRTGAIAVPLDPRCSEAELATILDDIACGSRWIITNATGAEQVRSIDGFRRTIIWTIDKTIKDQDIFQYDDLLAVRDERPPCLPDDLTSSDKSLLHYTSGSTGPKPKGVISSQGAWICSTMASMTTALKVGPRDMILCPLPITHAYGFSSGVIAALCSGASLHLTGSQTLAESLSNEPFTVILGVPTTYSELIGLADAAKCLSSIRLCISGGAPASPTLNEQVQRKFGAPILNHYGCTETCGAITVCSPNEKFAEGSSGSIIPGREIRIVHPELEQVVAHGEEGEIWIRSQSLLLQYHNEIASPLVAGWYRSGDLGRWDDRGNLIITGRLKEAITRGGYKIHPAEVEHVLNSCDGVKEAVVVAANHDVFGEVPVALLVADEKSLDLHMLIAGCRQALPNYKIPVDFYEIKSIPRTRGGKPRRRAATTFDRRRITIKPLTPAAIEDAIIEEFVHARGLPAKTLIDPTTPFSELGMNSLASIVIRDRLVSMTGLDLPITLLFEHANPRELGEYIHTKLTGFTSPDSDRCLGSQRKSSEYDDPIAIVSMSCRYPGGIASPEDLWRVLEAGIDVTSDFPTNRGWNLDALYSADPDTLGATTTRRGGFLHDMADFDARLFGMSPKEAEATDPQQRLLLQSTWELLERAGIPPQSLRGSDTGVYAGVMYNDYAGRFTNLQHEHEAQLGLGSAASVAAGRISHSFDFHGPALSVDTACSSSLVAIDQAIKALRFGECSLAVAGGVTVMASPQSFVMFSKQRGLSPDGRCRSYSDDANGTSWSEGVGLLLLERLSDAQRNKHQVLGLIRGVATNSDGKSTTLTSPSGLQQERVVNAALNSANLSTADVDVIEGHGTATPLGDLIEIRSLIATYGQSRREPALLGSLKSNLGHTQAAAGVAGIVKMIMAMQKGYLPASLHISKPSRHVDWTQSRIQLLTRARPWPQTERPRRAAVSAFGIGGTNAHVILEQGERQDEMEFLDHDAAGGKVARLCPWLMSGADKAALQAQAALVKTLSYLELSDIAFSLATTRSHLRYRAAIRPGDMDALEALARGVSGTSLMTGVTTAPRPVFMFSGQGGQNLGMFKEIRSAFPVFHAELQKVCDVLDPHLDESLFDMLQSHPKLLDRIDVAQTAIFAFQVALYRTLEHFGVVPAMLVGHSIGEVAVAHVGGILSLSDAAMIVAIRGRLMKTIRPGAMASIEVSEKEILEYLADIDDADKAPAIAAVNSQSSVVISGSLNSVAMVEKEFNLRDRRTKRLRISHACHSPSMDAIKSNLVQSLKTISFGESKIPIVSTVTGKAVARDDLRSAEYWGRHLVAPVRFRDAIQTARDMGGTVFLEMGPMAALVTHVQDSVPTGTTVQSTIDALTELHVRGVDVNWSKVLEHAGTRKVDLPTYPFQRKRYWLDPPTAQSSTSCNINHAFLSTVAPSPFSGQVILHGRVSSSEHPWLKQHVMSGRTIFPAAAFADIAVKAGSEIGLSELTELTLVTLLDLSTDTDMALQVVIETRGSEERRDFKIFSRSSNAALSIEWNEHASGILSQSDSQHGDMTGSFEWPMDNEVHIDGGYDELVAAGIAYGPAFRCVDRLWQTRSGLVARLIVPESMSTAGHMLHPVLLDAAMHSVLLVSPTDPVARVPFHLQGIRLRSSKERVFRAVVEKITEDRISVKIYDRSGHEVAAISQVSLRSMRNIHGDLFTLEWSPVQFSAKTTSIVSNENIVRVRSRPKPEQSKASVHEAVTEILAAVKEWSSPLSDHDGSRLIIVTERATTDDLDLACAAVWGAVRSAQNEHAGRITLIDLDGSTRSENALDTAIRTNEAVVAVYNGSLHVPKLEREVQRPDIKPMIFEGTVLITGGTGALGHLVARHLAEKYKVKNMLLVSRSGSNANSLAMDDLICSGARITIKACDVADYKQLQAMLKRCQPPVCAVFHTAGVVEDGLLESLTPERVSRVLRPKVDGAWNLHRLLPQAKPFVLFSSAAGLLGNPGQANYAAGNTFLDALARRRVYQGLHALSIAWGPWQNEKGMAGKILEHGVLLPLSDQQGLDLLDQALQSTQPVLAPLLLRAQVPSISRTISRHDSPSHSNKMSLRKELSNMEPVEREETLQILIRKEIASILGYDQLPDLPVSEIGIDSLSGVQIRNRIASLTGVMLPSTVMFDVDDVAALATVVAGKLREETDNHQSSLPAKHPALLNGSTAGKNDMKLSKVCRQLCASRRFSEALSMLAITSLTLPTSTSLEQVPLRILRPGTNSSIAVVCLPDFLPPFANTSIFSSLLPFLDTSLDIHHITYPTETLPDTLATLLEALSQTLKTALHDKTVFLLGYSAGGLIAHALARALGASIAGLILFDTYPITTDVPNWLAALPGKRIVEAGEEAFDDRGLATMGHYMRLTQGYEGGEVGALTLLVRARDTPGEGMEAKWPSANEVRVVAGSHESLLGRDAKMTAREVSKWISEVANQD